MNHETPTTHTMSKSNPTTRPDAPNYEVVGNMIHRYEPMTVQEAFGVLSESKAPLCGFRDADFQPWMRGKLHYVIPSASHPYRAVVDAPIEPIMKFMQCARLIAEDPRKVPEGVPELLEPWLAYVGKGPIRGASEDQCTLHSHMAGSSLDWIAPSNGLSPRTHYAIDVRTTFAREHFPEYVQALGYPMEDSVPKVKRATADEIDRANSAKDFAAWIKDYARDEKRWGQIARDAFNAGREYERKAAK